MFDLSSPLSLALAAVAAIAGLCLACGGQKREQEMRSAAGKLGFRYEGRSAALSSSSVDRVASLRSHDRNFFSHVLDGGDVYVADWTWRDAEAKKRLRGVATIVAIERRNGDGPSFVWGAHGGLSAAVVRRMGGPIAFPDDPAFADRHHLAGPEPTRVRALFDGFRRAQVDRPDGMQVEAEGPWLVFLALDGRLGADRIDGFVTAARSIARALEAAAVD